MHTNLLNEEKLLSMHWKITFSHCPNNYQHFKWEIKKKTKANNLFHKKKDQKIM